MEKGIIGTYHDREIELVERADYDAREDIDCEKIYGLIEENNELILLVFQGRWIGTMTKKGIVTEFKNPKKYSEKKKLKVEEKKEGIAMKKLYLEEFIKFVKKEYGMEIEIVKKEDGDTFEKIFGDWKFEEPIELLGREVSRVGLWGYKKVD